MLTVDGVVSRIVTFSFPLWHMNDCLGVSGVGRVEHAWNRNDTGTGSIH